MFEVKSLDAFYGKSQALVDVSFQLSAGGFLAILGKNGMGKTTLLNSIVGGVKAKGSIRLDGYQLDEKRVDERVKRGIGYVPQGRGIFPKFSVQENLAVGLFTERFESESLQSERLDFVFDLFPILKEFLSRKGGDLSGGQQQQLAIGRALMTNPKILLLDEPMEGIQPNIVEQIEQVLVRLNSELGLGILLVEQNLEFLRRNADSFLILDRGHVVSKGEIGGFSSDLIDKYLTA
jgi:urea transport system ATP-binding protein